MGNHSGQPHEVEGAGMKGDNWRRITETDRPKDGEVCFLKNENEHYWIGYVEGGRTWECETVFADGRWVGFMRGIIKNKPTHWHPFPGRVEE